VKSELAVLSPGQGRQHVGYVVSLFPSYDETFILREIKALSERGVRLTIFSLRKRRQAVVQEDARPFLSATRHAGYCSADVLAATGRALWRRPLEVARLVGIVVRGTWRYPDRLLRSIVMLPKAFLFAEVAASEGIEHLHAHWATYPATVALVMSRLTGISWSLTCHAHDIFLNPSLLPEKLERAEFVLTCTSDNKRHLETVSPVSRHKVKVSYHGLDLRLFRPAPPHFSPGAPSILAVGSLLECKGFDILLEACGRLRRQGLDFALTLAGGGPEEASLRATVRREGLDRHVRFTGFVTQRDLVPLYQRADLFVLPAVLEIHWGIPNVLVEALACGVPVITTALPSLTELVEDGREGLVARNRDPEDLARKMATLLRDPGLRRAMGQAGRARVESSFDIDRTIESVVEPLVGRAHAAV
jgi:glycosyltransferase involved in cell wall biosynthesis